jgi:hypothetical protein
MAKATSSYGSEMVLARWLAKKAVLEQCRAQGLRPWWDCEARDVHKMAEEYLKDHPQLWTEANALAVRISQHMHRKRRTVSKQQSLCSTPVQNGRPE